MEEHCLYFRFQFLLSTVGAYFCSVSGFHFLILSLDGLTNVQEILQPRCSLGRDCFVCLPCYFFSIVAQVERCDPVNDGVPPFLMNCLSCVWLLAAFDVCS